MPPQARKTSTPATRARREVRAEKNKVPPLKIQLRGETFEIPLDRMGSDRVWAFTSTMQDTNDHGTRLIAMGRLVRTLVGPSNEERFTDLARDDEPAGTLVIEFLAQMNKASNLAPKAL